MGFSIAAEASAADGVEITGLFEASGHPSVGKAFMGVTVCDSVAEASGNADVVVDFTSPEAALEGARYCSREGKAMVIGTTGFTDGQMRKIKSLVGSFPCVMAPNMSVGVNLVEKLVSLASEKLSGFDIEIFEMHHAQKVDSPSGTALALAQAAADARRLDLENCSVYSRGETVRKKDEIGIQSVRGGTVVGEHTVLFIGNGERVEITHRAESRNIFAAGAVRAARWVCGKPPGLYGMSEVLELGGI